MEEHVIKGVNCVVKNIMIKHISLKGIYKVAIILYRLLVYVGLLPTTTATTSTN